MLNLESNLKVVKSLTDDVGTWINDTLCKSENTEKEQGGENNKREEIETGWRMANPNMGNPKGRGLVW